MSAPAPALALERVTYRYPGAPEPALRDVSVAIEPGELVVLAGRSASGKSTLLGAACGLVPHFHGGEFAGRLRVAGLDTRDHGPGEIAAAVGTLFQEPETQVVMGTVRAELAFPLENRGEGDAAVARGVEEAALALGIAGLLDRPTHELSGGELQRVALGAALAGRPALVLLDEPTAQLDPVAGDELIWLLRRLNEEWGTTIVLAEHRLERCLAAADRVIALAGGQIACDAAPGEFLAWAADSAPTLQTPAARLFQQSGLTPPPTGVKQARATLRRHGLLGDPGSPAGEPAPETSVGGPSDTAAAGEPGPGDGGGGPWDSATAGEPESGDGGGGLAAPEPAAPGTGPPRRWPRRRQAFSALAFEHVWHELPAGRTVLRDVDLALARGERVALMGRNGAGKSTLLRHAAGLMTPTRGRVRASGRVALLLQDPGAYLIAERVADEAPPAALAVAGLGGLGDRHPRDLSGGERQRLALAIVLGDGDPPAAVCLDEPTRGMDRAHRDTLLDLLHRLADAGSAVLVATHDAELAAALADRVILLGDAASIADGTAAEVLAGGWYFATETARVLGGAGGALSPEAGAALLHARRSRSDPLAELRR